MRLSLGTHAQRLERWIGAATAEKISRDMAGWYGPPIAIGGVPGNVWALPGGDIRGRIGAGQFGNALEWGVSRLQAALRRHNVNMRSQCNAGFASFSDLLAEASAGKARDIYWQKAGPTGVVAVTSSLWRLGNQPAAGSAGSAAPGGRAPTGSGTTGAQFGLDNVSTDTRHFVSAQVVASVAGNTLLMYDRIFDVAKTMNSTTNESVTGVPSRYQSSTTTAADYAGGNFVFVEVGGTALAATAHNWGVAGGSNECLYRNQAGTDNSILPVFTGVSGAIVDRLDHGTSSWFMPLASGDTGIMDLAQMRCSALVATGTCNFVIGHPIAWMPCPVANMACTVDGLNTAFSLVRVFDDAALAFLEVSKPATTATTYTGTARFIHG
jgi:hypothetical protein